MENQTLLALPLSPKIRNGKLSSTALSRKMHAPHLKIGEQPLKLLAKKQKLLKKLKHAKLLLNSGKKSMQ